MNPEKQRIALAEACGWRLEVDRTPPGYPIYFWFPPGKSEVGNELWMSSLEDSVSRHLPDYLNDLNAMADAVIALLKTDSEQEAFGEILLDMIGRKEGWGHWWPGHHLACDTLKAGPAMICEALLRAIGKWEGEKEEGEP